MRIYEEQIIIPDNEFFTLRKIDLPQRYVGMHRHRELELVFMLSGKGVAYIGDYSYAFDGYDLVLIGPNLPHNWDVESPTEQASACCFCLQFKEDFTGTEFLQKSAMDPIRNLFLKARGGIKFYEKTQHDVLPVLTKLFHAYGIERILLFFQLFKILTESGDYSILNQAYPFSHVTFHQNTRQEKLFQYIYSHYTEEISLQKAAEIMQMRKDVFCTFFKKRTLKTFSNYIIELRIHHSIKLVTEKNYKIAEAAYASGFNNISFFNRKFKQLMNINPKTYFQNQRKQT